MSAQRTLDEALEDSQIDTTAAGEPPSSTLGPGAYTLLELRARLFRKLHNLQAAVAEIEAEKKGRYADYASPGKVIAELAPRLNADGLVLVWGETEVVAQERVDVEKTDPRSGVISTETWRHSTVWVAWELVDTDTGYGISGSTAGGSYNKDGQDVLHASRQAQKYALLSLFQVNVSRDPQNPEPPPPSERHSRPQTAERSAAAPTEGGRAPRPSSGHQAPESGALEVGSRGFDLVGGEWVCKATDAAFPRCEECGGVYLSDGCVNDSCEAYRGDKPRPTISPAPEGGNGDARRRKLKEEYARLAGELNGWQEEALIRQTQGLREDPATWDEEEYQAILRVLRARQHRETSIRAAAAALARDEPADPDRIQYLRELADDADLPMKDRTELQVAIDSGWHDAIEEEIQTLERRLEEAGEGGENGEG